MYIYSLNRIMCSKFNLDGFKLCKEYGTPTFSRRIFKT